MYIFVHILSHSMHWSSAAVWKIFVDTLTMFSVYTLKFISNNFDQTTSGSARTTRSMLDATIFANLVRLG